MTAVASTSEASMSATIGQAVNLIIYLKYVGKRRIVEDIIEVEGYKLQQRGIRENM